MRINDREWIDMELVYLDAQRALLINEERGFCSTIPRTAFKETRYSRNRPTGAKVISLAKYRARRELEQEICMYENMTKDYLHAR